MSLCVARGDWTNRRHAAGFSMIEVLVSVAILAFGVIGMAGLQAVALRNNLSAQQRSIATQLAYDIGDRMRANKLGFDQGKYFTATGILVVGGCSDAATGCSPLELAQTDYQQWLNGLAAALPSGKGFICLDATPDDGSYDGSTLTNGCTNDGAVTVKIFWADDRSTQTLSYKRFSTVVKPW